MRSDNRKFRVGLTLIELIITMVIASMLVLAAGVLLVSGQRAWQQTYNSAHKQIKEDAYAVMVAFGSMGRKANKLGYTIYNMEGGVFVPAVPQTSDPQEVVSGDAVEFRYWDVELDASDSHDLMDITKTATAYALFYLDGNRLKVDYGPYPPGAVPTGGGARNTSNVTTTILAENVTADDNIGAFSHTTLNGVGQGCVRINITLTDPQDGDSVKVMTATLMRNIWPR
jgi:Tfp pilus assembly protein PilV